jgi:ankyrin repeat protein
VAALLQHGADPNAVDALGNTALHYAVHSENTFIASQLLEHSANIEAKTKVKATHCDFQPSPDILRS